MSRKTKTDFATRSAIFAQHGFTVTPGRMLDEIKQSVRAELQRRGYHYATCGHTIYGWALHEGRAAGQRFSGFYKTEAEGLAALETWANESRGRLTEDQYRGIFQKVQEVVGDGSKPLPAESFLDSIGYKTVR